MNYIKSIPFKIAINIKFALYKKYENQNTIIIKNQIINLIDKHKNDKSVFYFNAFKVGIRININQCKYLYNNYSLKLNEMDEILQIKDNDIFIIEFKNKINEYNDLFLLYLFLKMCKN